MAFKQFLLDDGTPVTIYKRKASRNLRLTISAEGAVKVSIPRWAAYGAGLKFAESRSDWIKSQRQMPAQLTEGQSVGKAHRLRFQARTDVTKVASRLKAGEIIISYPEDLASSNPAVQQAARRAAVRALRRQAEQLLPQRLEMLARTHGFKYRSVSIKQMKSRWGSCDHNRNIVLNLYLIQLPWQNIDYVILHELTHTEVMRHGPDFWHAMAKVLPDAKRLRKAMHTYQPVVHDPAQLMS